MVQKNHEQWLRKEYRRRLGVVGWILVIYYLIMNVSVAISSYLHLAVELLSKLWSTSWDDIADIVYAATESAWGYFLAAAIGLLILMVWKKPKYWREEIWKKGKVMKPGIFLGLTCIFMSSQLVYQVFVIILELFLRAFGMSMMEGISSMAMDTDNFSMFLYAGILAPISEEILFRGLIQRTLLPYGKRLAILCSAVTFGIFHGNILQSPFAFLVGLVLGYVAAEYSLGWAMVLHMMNNLVLADMLPRLTSGLPEIGSTLIFWAILLLFAIGAVVTLVARRAEIRAWLARERMNRFCLPCFFSSAGVVTLMVIMGLSMILSTVLMIRLI